MAEDTFQLTRVRDDGPLRHCSSELSHQQHSLNLNRPYLAPKPISTLPPSSLSALPPIRHVRSNTHIRYWPKSTSSLEISVLDQSSLSHTRMCTTLSTPQIMPNLVSELKQRVSKSFDFHMANGPETISEAISKISKKEASQKHLRRFKAKMLELRKKADSLEKERQLKEERLEGLLNSNKSLAIVGTQQDLTEKADEIEARIACLSEDYSNVRGYMHVLEEMAKKRTLAKKFYTIRNDKAKETLSRLIHQIQESEKELLHEKLDTRSLKSQIRQLKAEASQAKKQRKAEIKTVIKSYREDLMYEHHIAKNQQSIEIMAKIRKNKALVELLERAENRQALQEKCRLSLKIHDSCQDSYKDTLKRLHKATRVQDTDSAISIYNGILLTSNDLVIKKAEIEAELEDKRQQLIQLRNEREAAYIQGEHEGRVSKSSMEVALECRSIEIARKEESLVVKQRVAALMLNEMYRLCCRVFEVTGNTTERLALSTDVEGLTSQLADALIAIIGLQGMP